MINSDAKRDLLITNNDATRALRLKMLEFAAEDPHGYLVERIPAVLAVFHGSLTFNRLADNLGDPNRCGYCFAHALVRLALDALIAQGTVEKEKQRYILIGKKGLTTT